MQVHAVAEGVGPIRSRKRQAVEEGTDPCTEFVVIDLNASILGGGVRSRWFGLVVMVTTSGKKGKATSEFTALVRSNEAAVGEAVSGQEFVDDINRRCFAVCKENPDIARRLVDNKKV